MRESNRKNFYSTASELLTILSQRKRGKEGGREGFECKHERNERLSNTSSIPESSSLSLLFHRHTIFPPSPSSLFSSHPFPLPLLASCPPPKNPNFQHPKLFNPSRRQSLNKTRGGCPTAQGGGGVRRRSTDGRADQDGSRDLLLLLWGGEGGGRVVWKGA